jgi:hypothetical protein
MEQERPSKWESPIMLYGGVALFLIAFFGAKAALGPAWKVVFAALIGLEFLWLAVFALRRPDNPRWHFSRLAWLGWTLMVGGAIIQAADSVDVGLPVMLLGLGLLSVDSRRERRRNQTEQ